MIGKLYAWERRWDEANAQARANANANGTGGVDVIDATQRSALRKIHFARHLKWLHALAQHWRNTVLPKSPLGEAGSYLLNQWAALAGHLEHGQTRLDNNAIENAIRPSAIGKKNWLFIGHPDAGQRSAIIYSLVVSCQRHGKDPHVYLRDVLTRLPRMTNRDDLRALTPAHWTAPASVPA